MGDKVLEICLSFKRKLQCKPQPKQVHDPKTFRHQKDDTNNQRRKSGLLEHSNIQGIIQGSKRYFSSRKPEGNIDISDPIIDGVLTRRASASSSSRLTNHVDDYDEENVSSRTRLMVEMDSDDCRPSMLICYTCGEKLKNLNAVEAHHITEHSGNSCFFALNFFMLIGCYI